jgi:hypothetical protein
VATGSSAADASTRPPPAASGYRGSSTWCSNLSAWIDGRGTEHEFRFRTRLFGPGMAIDAFELRDGSPAGYEFQVIGEPDDDPLELLGKLIGKMRRALALTHIEDTDHGPQVNDRLILRGTVDSDPDEDHRVPMVVIDGREISWDELGRMVATFEGWQFKLEFRDRSEEV